LPDSSGTFSRLYNFTADAAANIAAQPGRFDNEFAGMATALTNRMTRDGQAPALGNLPMGGFKLTGMGTGTATGQSVNYDQLILKADSTALSDTTGAALIGVTGGGTVQASITSLNASITGINYNDTSVTSVLIATGAQSFTVSTGKLFQVGQFLLIASTASPANYMLGQVTSYATATGALVMNITSIGGSGTFAAWTVSLSAPAAGAFSGGILTSLLTTTASVIGSSGLNVPHGTAPTTPVNGDVWTTTAAVFARVNGVTQQLATTAQLVTFTGGTLTSLLTTVASAAGTAGINVPHGAAPTSPLNGDLWTTLTGAFVRVNSVTQQLAPLAAPAFTGAPTAATAAPGTNTTQIGTTAFTTAAIAAIPVRPTFGTPSASFSAADADNNTHKVASGATQTLTLGSITAGTAFTIRFTTAWSLAVSGGLSKNGAAPAAVTTGTIAANSFITFLHEGAGVWAASGSGLS
jgi:hypothetical protein